MAGDRFNLVDYHNITYNGFPFPPPSTLDVLCHVELTLAPGIMRGLLQAFKSQKPAFGAWITAPGVLNARSIAQAAERLGISWLTIDCEHGMTPLVPGVAESITAIQSATALQSSSGGGPSVIVRVPATGYGANEDVTSAGIGWQIKYALDAGAVGVLVPMVSTVEKAKSIVSESRFAPLGRRGFGSPYTHGTWGLSATEYIKKANEDVQVMIQIETKEGLENVKELAEVQGVDVLFIGPYDLSIALGYPPPSPDPHPEVEKVIQHILSVTHSAGKKCAFYCINGRQAATRVRQGFDMICVMSDVGAMNDGMEMHMRAATGPEISQA